MVSVEKKAQRSSETVATKCNELVITMQHHQLTCTECQPEPHLRLRIVSCSSMYVHWFIRPALKFFIASASWYLFLCVSFFCSRCFVFLRLSFNEPEGMTRKKETHCTKHEQRFNQLQATTQHQNKNKQDLEQVWMPVYIESDAFRRNGCPFDITICRVHRAGIEWIFHKHLD